MFEATRSLPDAAYAAKRTATDFTLEIKQPLSEPLSLATRKQGSRSSTIAGKIHPSKNICRFYRATVAYRLTLKDIQMINMRLKGNGIYWLKENAESMLQPPMSHRFSSLHPPMDSGNLTHIVRQPAKIIPSLPADRCLFSAGA